MTVKMTLPSDLSGQLSKKEMKSLKDWPSHYSQPSASQSLAFNSSSSSNLQKKPSTIFDTSVDASSPKENLFNNILESRTNSFSGSENKEQFSRNVFPIYTDTEKWKKKHNLPTNKIQNSKDTFVSTNYLNTNEDNHKDYTSQNIPADSSSVYFNIKNGSSNQQPVAIQDQEINESNIYMDYQATTPVDPRVLDSMLPYFTTHFGNPHSRTHPFGWTAEQAMNSSRQQISNLLNCTPNEIVFTSGATESNNLAIKGMADFYLSQNITPHFITLVTEHKCVLNSFLDAQNKGCEVSFLPVNENGLVNLDTLKKAIKENTKLISVMAVNNEIGVIQDLKSIGEICKEKNIVFHTDAAQAVGKLPINVQDLNVSLLSGSGHKIYGPKGVGFLYVNKRNKAIARPRLLSIIKGGDQEFGLRAGTIPTALVVGLGKACEIAKKEMARDYQIVKKLSDRLVNYLKKNLKEIQFNGRISKNYESHLSSNHNLQDDGKVHKNGNISNSCEDVTNETGNSSELQSNKSNNVKNRINATEFNTYPGCNNISFSYVEGEGLLMKLKNIALSTGSACTSSSLEPSYILRALKVDEDLAHSSIRFGISKFTTKEDIDKVKKLVVEKVKELREMSPLYEMVNEGIDLKTIQWSQE